MIYFRRALRALLDICIIHRLRAELSLLKARFAFYYV